MKYFRKSLILFIISPFLVLSLTATWQDDLVEYYPQPVLSISQNDAYYPSVIYDPLHFGDDAGDNIGPGPETYTATPYYKMWFSNGSGCGFAYSDDGISWAISTIIPVTGLNNPHHVATVYTGGNYYIWYWDTSQLYSHASIRYAESTDGIVWSNDQATTGNMITGVSPDWNRGSYGPCQVFYNSTASNSGTNPFDYTFYMYFDSTTGGVEETGLGYSSNGTSWQLHGRILAHGISGDWDSSYASRGTVVQTAPSEWHMWYSGGQTRLHEGIGHAFSSDGLTWIKSTGNPVWHIADGLSHRDSRTYTPWILYRQDRSSWPGDNAQFKGWFSARSGSSPRTICYLGAPYSAASIPPVAVITGNEIICPIPDEVDLSGENSRDRDGEITEYRWEITSAPDGSLARIPDPGLPVIRFTADLPGEYTISLQVGDDSGEWSETVFRTINAGLGNPPELTISGSRRSEKSWLIIKDYFNLSLEIRENSGCRMRIKKLSLYRSLGPDTETLVMELDPAQFTLENGILVYTLSDRFFDHTGTYTYRLTVTNQLNEIATETNTRFEPL